MGKPYKGPWVLRSVLFVPSHISKMVNKASGSNADCVVFDLEDAVPAGKKQEARESICTVLESGKYSSKTVFVRVNPINTGLTLRDLESVACKNLNGFVYPMANNADDVKNFDAQLSLMESHLELPKGHFSIIVLIETPAAVLNTQEIVYASDRIVGLLFGCEDYLAEMDARHTDLDISLNHPRMMVALAARSAGVEAIDTPYVRVHDMDGLRIFASRARDLGMGGMLCMSPKQIDVAHQVYSPTEEEVQFTQEVVSAAEEAQRLGKGIVIVDEKFISPPTVKAAKRSLAKHMAIKNLEAWTDLEEK